MLKINDKIGEYTLIEKVGAGGFGDVWKAEKRTQMDVNYFALKFFRPKDDEVDLEKIQKELDVWKKLRGLPHIISVIELDKFDDYVYVVCDFADGGSLESWLKNNGGKTVSHAQAVKITLEILTGLENLHEKNVIHRDLKPDNILIMNGKHCLADFGVSREVKSHSKATGTAGTMEYMPPEAFENKFSVQTDIWAVGVILQRLLTGKLPFPQDNQAALVGAILRFEPEKLPANIPETLREVVDKCLQKEPLQRFRSVQDLKELLERFLRHSQKQSKTIDDVNYQKQHRQFAQTEVLPNPIQEKIAETEDWREIERQKQAKQAEIERLQAIEAERQQAELDAIQRKLQEKQNAKVTNVTNETIWMVGIGSAILLVLIVAAISTLNLKFGGNDTPTINSVANKPANTSATSNSPNTLKNSIGMEFVKIPAGTFKMGSPESEKDRGGDETQHEVKISKDFYLGKYEVTQLQWKALIVSNPSNFKSDNLPVEQVSWDDAQAFIKALNAKDEGTYRLPSEAEWEYAARGGTTTKWSFGGDESESGKYAWYSENAGNKTHEVGTKQPNKYGLYDMHGNVWEWCSDWYGAYPSGNVTDPVGAATGSNRVFRGGSWFNNGGDFRSAYRFLNSPSFRGSNLGFRLVRVN